MMNIENIVNINDLVNELNNTPIKQNISEWTNILNTYNSNDWKDHIKFSDIGYNKILLHTNSNYDLYLICWKENQSTKYHDHAKNGCLYKILYGKLYEMTKNNKNKLIQCKLHNVNDIGYIDNNIGYHKISSTINSDAISLHIYSPSNYKCKLLV
jgi:hypothetical protein